MAGDNVVNATQGWQAAEFNVFGDAGGGQANFNSASTMVVRMTVHHGSTAPPSCALESFTGETNNLTLAGAPNITTAPFPAIIFKQSNVAGTPPSCAQATGVGDTHLTTFGGLLYDYQASGPSPTQAARGCPEPRTQSMPRGVAPARSAEAFAKRFGGEGLATGSRRLR